MALTKVKNSVWNAPDNKFTTSVSGGVERSLQSRLEDRVNVKDFGAVGDGVADDAPAINAALNSLLTSGRRGIAWIPPGTYRTESTITVAGTGIKLEGSDVGELGTIINADHSAGAVIRVKDRRSGVSNLEITASTSRKNGVKSGNYGVYIESDDVAGFRPTHGRYHNLVIREQPNVGILVIAACWFSKFTNITIRDGRDNGMQFDYGSLTGRTVTENPGEVVIERCEVFDNEGHGIIIGNDDNQSNRGFRFEIFNLDLFRNAEAAGVRKSSDQAWFFMDTSVVEASAFDGSNIADTTAVTRGFIIHGRANTIRNCRYLNVTPQAARIADIGVGGFTTEDITIESMAILGDHQASLDPVVSLEAGVSGIVINSKTEANVVGYYDTNTDIPLYKQTLIVSKENTQTVNNSTTLINDDELLVAVRAKERVQFRFSIWYRGDDTADIKFGLIAPSGANIVFGPAAGVRVNGADDVVVQNSSFSTSVSIPVGTDSANNPRLFELVGEVRTTGTAGNLQLQWAQASAVVANTQVLGQSYLSVNR